MTTVGFIGSGQIGSAIARLAIEAGHQVVLSNSRSPETLADLVSELGPQASAASSTDAAAAGDIVTSSPSTAGSETNASNINLIWSLTHARLVISDWKNEYNHHRALGMRPPVERFRFARPAEVASEPEPAPASSVASPRRVPGVTRWVDRRGSISLARFEYRVGPVFAGQLVEAVVDGGLVQIYHQGVLVATHVQRLRPADTDGRLRGTRLPVARAATSGMSVLRIADNNGNVSFAGTMYSAGRMWRGLQLDVRIVGASVQISKDEQIIRVHAIRHDRAKEHGAYANPVGRPRKNKRPVGDPAPAQNVAASGGRVKATAAPRSA